MKTKSNKIVSAILLLTVCFSLQAQETVTDIDGNIYNTVTIGTQKWMKENLKTTRYNNGDSIAIVTDAAEWINLTSGAYSNYNNDSNNVVVHGRLYNGFTVIDNRNLCPSGWHVPIDSDWTTLTTFLGGENVSGGKMKETGTAYWNSPNTGATNTSGFTALPSGGRMYTNGTFQYIGQYGGWWSSTEQDDNFHIKYRNIGYNENIVGNYSSPKQFGFSVRCIEDPIPDSAKYFRQTPPGKTAEIFAPGIISLSDRLERGITFSPDGKECYFGTFNLDSFSYKIYYTNYIDSVWTAQQEAPFSINHFVESPFFSADGHSIYFNTVDGTSNDIFKVERDINGWGDAQILESQVNSSSDDNGYTETETGDKFFSSNRSNENDKDIWYLTNSATRPVRLESNINSSSWDQNPYIGPDGSFLIFSSERNGRDGLAQLFISFKKEDNEWSNAINMNSSGAKINDNAAFQAFPSLSPDGKYLFFMRHYNIVVMDIYWVSTSIIDDLKEIVFSTSVKESERAQIQIFPNPATQTIQIKGIDMLLNGANYQLIDLNGKTIKQGKLKSETIDISELPIGIYVLSLQTNKGIVTEKIVIE